MLCFVLGCHWWITAKATKTSKQIKMATTRLSTRHHSAVLCLFVHALSNGLQPKIVTIIIRIQTSSYPVYGFWLSRYTDAYWLAAQGLSKQSIDWNHCAPNTLSSMWQVATGNYVSILYTPYCHLYVTICILFFFQIFLANKVIPQYCADLAVTWLHDKRETVEKGKIANLQDT